MFRVISSIGTKIIGARWEGGAKTTKPLLPTIKIKKQVISALKSNNIDQNIMLKAHQVDIACNQMLNPVCYEKVGDIYSALFYTNKTFLLDYMQSEKEIKKEINHTKEGTGKDESIKTKKEMKKFKLNEENLDHNTALFKQFETTEEEKEEEILKNIEEQHSELAKEKQKENEEQQKLAKKKQELVNILIRTCLDISYILPKKTIKKEY